MNLSLKELSRNFDTAPAASEQEIAAAESHFGFVFPTDYKDFLRVTNGLEGMVDNKYLVLWTAAELIELNVAYKVRDYIQDIIIFVSDGAEDAYAFDISGPNPLVVTLPFIGMGHIDNKKLADTFEAFLLPRIRAKGVIKRLFG